MAKYRPQGSENSADNVGDGGELMPEAISQKERAEHEIGRRFGVRNRRRAAVKPSRLRSTIGKGEIVKGQYRAKTAVRTAKNAGVSTAGCCKCGA